MILPTFLGALPLSDGMRTVVIQCATHEEFEAIRTLPGVDGEVQKIKKRTYFKPFPKCIVVKGAVGKVWAAASAEFLIHEWSPQLVIDFGAGGALTDSLRLGDLVLANKVIEHDVVSIFKSKLPTMRVIVPGDFAASLGECATLRGLQVESGAIASGDADIDSAARRAELHKKTGAVLATWESSAIARVAHLHEVSFLSLRVVSDVGGDQNLRDEYVANVTRVLPPAAEVLMNTIKPWLSRS